MTKPIIGILLDYSTKKESEGGYSDFPWYALREHYDAAIYHHGGIPILLPYRHELINEYVQLCAGFVFSGGDYDIDPKYYGEKIRTGQYIPDNPRTSFEIKLMQQVLEQNKPLLAICAGQQMLNVILGGSLYQDIGTDIKTNIKHTHKYSNDIPWHDVEIQPDTKLVEIVKNTKYKINSHHRQAVKNLGKGLVVNAIAPDGVIEGIELPGKKFCIGVEWHPEFEKTIEDQNLIGAFVESCRSA